MTKESRLAINGGPKAKTVPYGGVQTNAMPYGIGMRFKDNELKYLAEALDQNTLFYDYGKMVKRACAQMREYTDRPYVFACSSGSAAIHLGLIAAGIGPGDEVILTPCTDSGSVLGIIEEGAVPIFCDCAETLQPTPETVAAQITERTKAVVVIHLAGYPAPVDEIVNLCKQKGIGVVEDCAQSWGARLNGKLVGTFGTAGCYSINDFKHISTGDGGFVALADEELYRRVSNYGDKHYDRLFDRSRAQVHHGVNYRMSELQGAVACAQLEKVDKITARHHEMGERLRERLKGMQGGRLVAPIAGGYSAYWWTVIIVDVESVTVSRNKIVEALQAEGISAGSYEKYDLIGTGLFQKRVARPWLDGKRSMYPFVQPDGREYTYSHKDTPVHKKLLDTGISLGVSYFYTEQDIEETADGILKVFDAYAR